MTRALQLTATKVRVMAGVLLLFGALCLLVGIWVYAKMLSHMEVTWQVIENPIDKAQFFFLLPFGILGLVVGSAGLFFLKSWARPVLLAVMGVELVNGVYDFAREPDILGPLFSVILLGVFLLVARSKPYLQKSGI